MRDVVTYTLARLLLVIALTAVIFYAAHLLGIREFPLVIAMLFAIILALPLGFWLLAPLRRRATAGIAARRSSQVSSGFAAAPNDVGDSGRQWSWALTSAGRASKRRLGGSAGQCA